MESREPLIPAALPNEYLSISTGTWFYHNCDLPSPIDILAPDVEHMFRSADFHGEGQELVNSLNYILTTFPDCTGWFASIQYDFTDQEARQIIAYCLTAAKELGKAYSTPAEIPGLSLEPLQEWRTRRKNARSGASGKGTIGGVP